MAEIGRPKRLSDADLRGIAAELVDDLLRTHAHKMPSRDRAIDHVARYAERHMDGYEIAKSLDGTYHWDCDLGLAEDLDGWGHCYSEKLRQRQKEWAATADLGTPLKPGTRVTAIWGRDTYTGKIKEIYEYGPAQYVIEIDGRDHKGGGAIVDYENVTPLEGDTAIAKATGSA